MADRYREPQNGARPLAERGGAKVVSVGGYVEGRTKGIPGAFVVFVSRVSLEGSPIRLSPHMARTMRLPIILHTGNTQALRAVGKVTSLYHRLMLSHTWFLTLFCGHLGQCSLYKGTKEARLSRLSGIGLKGRSCSSMPQGRIRRKNCRLRSCRGALAAGKNLRAAGGYGLDPA